MLAELGLAPRLWFCERVEDAGGLYVVVMDYVDSVGYSKQNSRASQWVRRAIKHLHSHGYVFGDLRDSNVLVTRPGIAMLVDFDWCDKLGEARYPLDINLNKEEVKWHPDVCPGGLIEMEHDEFMYEMLTAQEL
jgi:serine/threonine protein kinase